MELTITPAIKTLVDLGLTEDQVGYDITSAAFFGAGQMGRARIIARQKLVVAGGPVARTVFRRVDERITFESVAAEGQSVDDGDLIATVEGPVSSLLKGERTALNFLQRMGGVATHTAAHVAAVPEVSLRVVDTRKTLPGWRLLDKYAVRCGGGHNHRFNLAGGAMIKENHIQAAGGVAEAIERVRQFAPHTVRIEVEVESIDEISPAVDHGADVILLDNMDNQTMAEAVRIIRDHRRGQEVVIEASGNMDIARIETLGGVGLDVVSVGALTHSAPAVDISMRME